ncbi:MAG TPA: hypothetical protein VN364_13190, partial [Bellilinea sp.]|nr:hypothetical protein [Bellilinea sp.]
ARPAAGKSEIIDFLKKTPPDRRLEKYHIGQMTEFDDFPLLWSWFEEDAILENMGYPRLHTDSAGYFAGNHHWDVLIERLGLEHQKWLRDRRHDSLCHTAIIEFSRGSEHGGYRQAFQHLSVDVASRCAILYVNVSWQESLRKNRKRFNPERPDSILEHGLDDGKLERLYRENDWQEISSADPEFIEIQGYRVPYAVLENESDITSHQGEALESRLTVCLNKLWDLFQKSQSS